jgi:hypothetical protein
VRVAGKRPSEGSRLVVKFKLIPFVSEDKTATTSLSLVRPNPPGQPRTTPFHHHPHPPPDILENVPLPDSSIEDLLLTRSPLEDPIIVQSTLWEIVSDLLGLREIVCGRDGGGQLARGKRCIFRQVEDFLGLWEVHEGGDEYRYE